ncbi:MAG TPA: GNAT family N-acetyltransferase [Nocardioides sp.]|nr:GNAT family N-acetyltransferase [Nocardioides sp.]
MATEVRLRDGRRALTWSVLPEDREAIREGYERLSEKTRYHRFLAAVPHLTDQLLDHLVDEVDGVDHVALVLFVLDDDNEGVPAGIARVIRYPGRPEVADVAVTVLDEWQGHGVATALLAQLMRERPAGVTHLETAVAADNTASLAMLRHLGELTVSEAGPGRLDVRVDLPDREDLAEEAPTTPDAAARPDRTQPVG